MQNRKYILARARDRNMQNTVRPTVKKRACATTPELRGVIKTTQTAIVVATPCLFMHTLETGREKSRAYRLANATTIRIKSQARRTNHHNRMTTSKLAMGGCCAKCGTTDLRILQFDHIDPSTKLYAISAMRCADTETFLAEVQKCQLLCANCHQIKTHHTHNDDYVVVVDEDTA